MRRKRGEQKWMRRKRGEKKWMRGKRGWRIMEMDGEEDLSGKEDEGMENTEWKKDFSSHLFLPLSGFLSSSLSHSLFDSSSFLFSSSPLPASISSTHSYSSRFTSVQSEDKIVYVCKNIIWWLGKREKERRQGEKKKGKSREPHGVTVTSAGLTVSFSLFSFFLFSLLLKRISSGRDEED